ncbi:hypothetical protein AB0J38_14555 [Streptomyces sp. NPDC050095]|uniref:hypothetical protein n=1 Tax=unclassified Streptomyces TaxID=2593676 RepID=UPI003420FE93
MEQQRFADLADAYWLDTPDFAPAEGLDPERRWPGGLRTLALACAVIAIGLAPVAAMR